MRLPYVVAQGYEVKIDLRVLIKGAISWVQLALRDRIAVASECKSWIEFQTYS
ncbi:hypothetical protein NUACC26_030900 [Scytonema sp. NUACC26]